MCSSLQFSCSVVKKTAASYPEHFLSNTSQHKAPKKSCRLSVDQVTGRMDLLRQLLLCSNPTSAFSTQLQEEVVGHMQETLQESRFNTLALATRLAAAGYAVIMRTAKGGGPTFSCFRNLRHEFLTVRGRDDCKGMDFIIEPSFRCHFEIAHPAPEYKVLLDAVPSVFVGRPSQLTRLVESLCAEIAISFQNQGMALPPWRRTDSVLSKWLSTNVNDVTVLANLPEACDVTRAARLVLV